MGRLSGNGTFPLLHSVGNLQGNSEMDVPLTYADYHFLEAMTRLLKQTQKSRLNRVGFFVAGVGHDPTTSGL